jgi:predicted HNH restriction endonuclease
VKKNPEVTPRSRIVNALRMLFLRSRERAAVVKRDHNTCQHCGRKGSVAKGHEVKIQVHHLDGITNWDEAVEGVYKNILCSPDRMECICKECHKEIHHG